MKRINRDSNWIDKSCSEWLNETKTVPIPKMLFGEFWWEGELCFMVADSEAGKSILAVQIGNSISKGKQLPIQIPVFAMEASQQKVLYFDFELSAKKFEKRYSQEYQNHYKFNKNFRRIKKNYAINYDDSLITFLERKIIESKATAIIIDNLTTLADNIENASVAKKLMETLNRLKEKYGLSILVLAHTPKRNLSKPFTKNDLGGSRKLYALCDSAFAIGESANDINVRYLKQLKVRDTEKLYHTNNVVVCQICKPKNFLHFDFLKFGKEQEHLKVLKDEDRESLINEVIELHQAGLSYREIGTKLGISHMKVSRIIKGGNL